MMIIQTNDVICDSSAGPAENGKYIGWIMKNEDRWAPLLNTEPIFSSAEKAKSAMEQLVGYARTLKLPPPGPSLAKEDIEAMGKIVSGA